MSKNIKEEEQEGLLASPPPSSPSSLPLDDDDLLLEGEAQDEKKEKKEKKPEIVELSPEQADAQQEPPSSAHFLPLLPFPFIPPFIFYIQKLFSAFVYLLSLYFLSRSVLEGRTRLESFHQERQFRSFSSLLSSLFLSPLLLSLPLLSVQLSQSL